MKTTLAFIFAALLSVISNTEAQPISLYNDASINPRQEPIQIEWGIWDSSTVASLRKFYDNYGFFFNRPQFILDSDDIAIDTTQDSLIAEYHSGSVRVRRKHQPRNFLITQPPYGDIIRYIEPFSMIDFNRVNGFFLGIGSSSYVNFGDYDEFGIRGGIGYGFAEKKGQSNIGGEFRIPLETLKPSGDTLNRRKFIAVPTIALGAEYHNLTTTEDYWRTSKLENAFYAFFGREDFRDYFKIEGWAAHLAFRPYSTDELRIAYRSDMYYAQPQRVFYGRWGGNKALPMNPPVNQEKMNSIVLSYHAERDRKEMVNGETIFGDEVALETKKGMSYFVEAEFGSLPDSSNTFQRYILEIRRYQPVIFGVNIDSRLRIESTTGDAPWQKMQFLGGPSTLAAYKNKIFGGNRMALLNTELRINLGVLSTFFKSENVQLLVKNDFGYIHYVAPQEGLLTGFGGENAPSFIYNWGVGLGHSDGMEFGVMWRTDVSESPRFFFRLQRPF